MSGVAGRSGRKAFVPNPDALAGDSGPFPLIDIQAKTWYTTSMS